MGVRGSSRSCQAGGAQIRRGVNGVGVSLLELEQSLGRDWEQTVTIRDDGSIRRLEPTGPKAVHDGQGRSDFARWVGTCTDP